MLRPKFLTYWGRPICLRWWLVHQITSVLNRKVTTLLARARELLTQHHVAGRTSGEYLHGKRLADHARRFERWTKWLNKHSGPMYADQSKELSR